MKKTVVTDLITATCLFFWQDAELGLEHIPVRPKRWPKTQTVVERSLFSRWRGWEWKSQIRPVEAWNIEEYRHHLGTTAQHNVLMFVPLSPRSATYTHSRGPVPRPEVCLRSVSRSGHRLLVVLWRHPAQTQVETGTGPSQSREPDVPPVSPSNTQRSSLCRCQTWVARHLPSCSMTSTTPCARPTARPSLHSPTLRSL